jgi:(1->4)-alpha-D-glucan 1-alpha-D-glucosylmutase
MIHAPQAWTTEEMPPDRNDEYAFYQLLLAAWPPAFFSGALDPDAVAVFRLRIEVAMLKALREAKLRTTWATPDEAYEQATLDFVRRALDTARANPFLESFQAFLARVTPLGVRNSLVQAVLKLTVPGVPDIYQGAELWDLSLVDPDNRRPIDFDCRRDALEDVKGRTNELSKLLKGWPDGRIKLLLVAKLLRLRREYPALFDTGSYEPLDVTGPDAERVCAFMREADGARMIVAALLFPGRGGDATGTVALPKALAEKRWTSLFDGRGVEVGEGGLDTAGLFAKLPVCVVVAETLAAA